MASVLQRLGAALAVAALVLGGPAWAQRRAPGPAAADTVSELIVTASRRVSELTITAPVKCVPVDPLHMQMGGRPKVVSAFPGKGDVVRPGLLVMRVTFDQPMACEGRFYAIPHITDPCPDEYPTMLLSSDRRTIREVCVVPPGGHFRVKLTRNFVRTDIPAKSNWPFMSIRNAPAEAYELDFTSSAGPVVTDVCEAMAQDKSTFGGIVDCG